MKSSVLLIAMLLALTVSAKNYKGAEIYSTQLYLYGRFEMKIKSAPGSGQLSTFFLYRNNSEQNTTLWEEIDIEIFGKDSSTFQSNVIIERTEGKQLMTEQKHVAKTSLSANFHVYALEWTPDSINWYLDDSLMRTENVYAKDCKDSMSIRFNHWAANNSGWVGTFDTKVLPSYQYVDYISYSEYTPGTGDNGTDFKFSWKDDFTSLSSSRWAKANWTFGENYCDFLPANAYTEDGQLVLKLHDVSPPAVSSPLLTDSIDSGFTIYPNPFSTSTTIAISSNEEYCVRISSLSGTILFEQYGVNKNNTDAISEYISAIDKGMYVVSLCNDNQIVEHKIIIKN